MSKESRTSASKTSSIKLSFSKSSKISLLSAGGAGVVVVGLLIITGACVVAGALVLTGALVVLLVVVVGALVVLLVVLRGALVVLLGALVVL